MGRRERYIEEGDNAVWREHGDDSVLGEFEKNFFSGEAALNS